MNEVEAVTVRAFVRPERVDRWLTLLGNAGRREQVADLLRGDRDFDLNRLSEVKRSRDRNEWVTTLAARLRSWGAGDTVHVITGSGALDGADEPLDSALSQVLGHGPALLICVPGVLAYWEGEAPLRGILHRPE